MTDIERLLAIEEIKRLKSRYFYYADTKDWGRWRDEVWAPDAEVAGETPNGPFAAIGSEAIAQWAKDNMGQLVSIHMGHMPDIEILSDTTATGRWSMEDILRAPEGEQAPQGFSFLHGFGYYHDTYVRGPDGWRIKATTITRLHVSIEP